MVTSSNKLWIAGLVMLAGLAPAALAASGPPVHPPILPGKGIDQPWHAFGHEGHRRGRLFTYVSDTGYQELSAPLSVVQPVVQPTYVTLVNQTNVVAEPSPRADYRPIYRVPYSSAVRILDVRPSSKQRRLAGGFDPVSAGPARVIERR